MDASDYTDSQVSESKSVIDSMQTKTKEYLSSDYSLELSLMLVFIYLAAKKVYPVLQKDVLEGAQNDCFGYLTAYQ